MMPIYELTPSNTLFDGDKWPTESIELFWGKAWIDAGPSPAGNAGPYLKLPVIWTVENGWQYETVHRIYPKPRLGKVLDIAKVIDPDGATRWMIETAPKAMKGGKP